MLIVGKKVYTYIYYNLVNNFQSHGFPRRVAWKPLVEFNLHFAIKDAKGQPDLLKVRQQKRVESGAG